MIIFGIDPGVIGAISILENKKVLEVFDMPTMIDGKKNKKQVNGSQVTNIIKNNLNKDKEVIFAMKKGIKLTVKGESSRGTKTTDIYTLKGFTVAYNQLFNDC